MKVAIHLTHTEADDLSRVEAAAQGLGFTVTRRGDFLGRRHTELSGELSPQILEGLLNAPELDAVAA